MAAFLAISNLPRNAISAMTTRATTRGIRLLHFLFGLPPGAKTGKLSCWAPSVLEPRRFVNRPIIQLRPQLPIPQNKLKIKGKWKILALWARFHDGGACLKKKNDKKNTACCCFFCCYGWMVPWKKKENAAFELVAEVARIFNIQSPRDMVKLSGTNDQRKNKRKNLKKHDNKGLLKYCS